MSEEKKTAPVQEENLPALVKAAPELLPLWDWWVKEGKSTLIMLLVAGLAVGGFYMGRNWLRGREAAAANALDKACPSPEMMSPESLMDKETVVDLEKSVSDYGSTKAGPLLRLRLAKCYYENGRYEEACALYDKLIGEKDSMPALADVAVVGRAYALEGGKKYKEAQEAFDAYAKANTNSYLALVAQLGTARCKALQGDKAGAVKDLEALKAATKEEASKTRVDKMIDVVKRYDPSRPVDNDLFSQADDAAALLELEKPAAKPAAPAPAPAAKPAAPAPAPAAKPAAPAPAPAPAAKPAAPAPAPAPAAPAPAPAPAAKPAAPAPAPAAPAPAAPAPKK